MARLIDADALIHSICNRCNDVNYDNPCEPSDCALYFAVQNAPTVDAVPVAHGRWVDVRGIPSVNRKNVPIVKCSECEIYFCDLINNHHYMYRYCPNCGAKMDLEEKHD